ncbi:DUF2185 domain-containing protein [Fuerstiella marisgermanici]|uniref:Immunity protein Imm33 domain-containing protein n=1 Tax=Fuerstiella marisgermanici TaxID=1891926 RepID=A0A1P8WMY0_9PLAN|nr:DUF2185 domain-containing protein [Fuerstiella marisgermanici]APZ95414.1 hypothetical protein Fuma_05072 [Fuerstiella marisgermanici]
MKVGYILVSNEIMVDGKPIGFLYREPPDNSLDSGWRALSGDESHEYAEEANNFALYNASTVVNVAREIIPLLGLSAPVAFERDATTGNLVAVEDDEDVSHDA